MSKRNYLSLLLVVGCLSVTMTMILAEKQLMSKPQLSGQDSYTPIMLAENKPVISQKSIADAIRLFKIKMPDRMIGPTLDMTLQDRGLTSREGYFARPEVRIGPTAFTSWAVLGSTLAHEIEVHCQQNFLKIATLEKIGLRGIDRAERTAYSYELIQAERFGLTAFEQDQIQDTMNRFYPIDGSNQGASLAAFRLGLQSILRSR
jgi:hypothetical protein